MGLLTRHNGEVGFDSKVVDLIINCISSPQFLVLINGEARGLITPSKGLRQGNPFLHTFSYWLLKVFLSSCKKPIPKV